MTSQIVENFTFYKTSGISLQAIDQSIQEYVKSVPRNGWELVRFRIRNREILTLDPSPTQSTYFRWEAIYEALIQLSNLTSLPDIDFIVCVGDSLHPDAALFFRKYGVPIFAFAKSKNDVVSILMPDSEALSKGFYERVLTDTSQGRMVFPWHTKEEKAFWRGATTGIDHVGNYFLDYHNYQEFPRVKLVQSSAKYPYLIDAKLTVLAQADPRVFDLLSPYTGTFVSVIDHLRYKYQILIDGNTCTYSRAYWQLFSDCLIFKQTSPNIQWYYCCLSPYVHYIPLAYDLSDLKEKIEWARIHDAEAQQIVASANDFAQKNLKKEDVYFYLLLLLQKYGELQR
ncbi:MAG: glycosyltransferase family 90 protein [Rhabdochlamydiaceae bacterium]|jgi:hypothetical protein